MSPVASSLTSPAHVIYAAIAERDIQDTFNDVKASFSSWDSCMSKAYCKWPVVAAIIIGSLIVLSFLVSIIRCCCLGAECCCLCCSCCNACCPAPRGGRRKDTGGTAQQQQNWPQQQPYIHVQPMVYPSATGGVATFDAPSKRTGTVSEDALPAMPSWSNAQTRRVEDPDALPEEQEPLHDDHDDHEDAGRVPGQQSYAMGPMSPGAGGVASPQRQPSPYQDDARQSLLAPQPQRPVQQSALQSPVHSTFGYENTGYMSPASQQHQQQGQYGYGASELDTPQGQPSAYATNPYHDNSYGYNNQQQSIAYAAPTPAPSYHTQQPTSPYGQRAAYTSPPPPQQSMSYGYGNNQYSGQYQQQHPQEMGTTYNTQEMGTAYNPPSVQRVPSNGWSNGNGYDRRPANGSWREV